MRRRLLAFGLGFLVLPADVALVLQCGLDLSNHRVSDGVAELAPQCFT